MNNTIDMYELNQLSKELIENSELYINTKIKRAFRISATNNLSNKKIDLKAETPRNNIFDQAIQFQSEKKKSVVPVSSSLPKRFYKKQKRTNIDRSYLQQWLDSVLQDQQSKGPLKAVRKFQVDKRYLISQNLSLEEIEKLYHSLYVYSFGMKNLLEQILKNREQLVLKFWRVYLKLLQKSSEFQTIFHITEMKQFQIVQNLKKLLKEQQEQFKSEKQKMEKRQYQLEKQLNQKKQQIDQLILQRNICESNFQLTDEAFNEEVNLRLRFEEKINAVNTAHVQLKNKYGRVVEDFKLLKSEQEELKKKEAKYIDEFGNFRSRIKELQKSVQLQKQKILLKDKEIYQLKQQIYDIKQSNLDSVKSSSYGEIEIRRLLTQEKTYKLKISQENLMRESAQQAVNSKNKQIETLIQTIEAERVNNAKQVLKYHKLRQENNEKIQTIEIKEYENQQLNKQLKNLKLRLAQCQKRQNALKVTKEDLLRDIEYKVRKIEGLQENLIANTKIIETLRESRQKYEKMNNILINQNNQILNSLTEANGVIVNLKQDIKGYLMTIQSKQYLFKESENRLKSEIEVCRKKINNLSIQISQNELNILKQDEEILLNKAIIEQKNSTMQKMKISSAEKQNEITRLVFENKTVSSKIKILEQQIMKYKMQIETLSKIIAESKKSVTQLNSKNTSINYVLQEKKRKAEEELSGLKQTILTYKKLLEQKNQYMHPLYYWDIESMNRRFGQNEAILQNKIKLLQKQLKQINQQNQFNQSIKKELSSQNKKLTEELKDLRELAEKERSQSKISSRQTTQKLRKNQETLNQKTSKIKKLEKDLKKLENQCLVLQAKVQNKNKTIETSSQVEYIVPIFQDKQIQTLPPEINSLKTLKALSQPKMEDLPMDSTIHRHNNNQKIQSIAQFVDIKSQNSIKKIEQAPVQEKLKQQKPEKKESKKKQVQRIIINNKPQPVINNTEQIQIQKIKPQTTLNIKNIVNAEEYHIKKQTLQSIKSQEQQQQPLQNRKPPSSQQQSSRPITNKEFSRALKLTFMRK